MKHLPQTIMEMINHLVINHPDLAPTIEAIAAGAQNKTVYGYTDWEARKFDYPIPEFIKRACLLRNGAPNATWVETGTYIGETTELLRQVSKQVYSIEPEPALYANAKDKFKNFANVEIIKGLSEEVLPSLLPKLDGDVNLWLDGHFSGNATFAGPLDTPVKEELAAVAQNLPRWGKVSVLVDDIRDFTGKVAHYGEYPTLDFLVDWARANKLAWHIEFDMFVAKNWG